MMLRYLIQDSVAAGLEVSPATYAILDNMLVSIDSLTLMTNEIQYRSNVLRLSMDSIYVAFRQFDFPKEMDIDMANNPNAPYFYLPVIYYGQYADYSATLSLEANDVTAVVQVYATTEEVEPIVPQPIDTLQPVTPILSLTEVQTEMQCEPMNGLMAGAGYVIGVAQGIDTIHFHFPATGNFSLIDPNTAVGAPFANGAGGVGEGGAEMPNFLKDLDIVMANCSSAPYFYCPVVYYGPTGDFSEIMTISAPGLDTVSVLFHAYPMPEDTTQVGDPYFYPSTTELVLTGANPETWALATGSLTISAGNIDTLQLQMQSGRNIQIGDNSSFATLKTFYLNYAEQTTIDVLMLLNTVTPGMYTDVLTISAPGTNLRPIEVYISALVEEQQGGDTTHVDPGYFNAYERRLSFSCYLTDLQDTTLTPSMPSTFYEYNLDSLVVELASGAQFILGNEETGQMGTHLIYTYQPNTKLSGMVKVMFTDADVTEPGYYVDTLIYRPYDGNGAMQPVYVAVIVEVIDNTQPMFTLEQTAVSQSKEKDTPWYHSVVSAVAYTANINSIHYWLAQGTHFKLLDIREFSGGSFPETLDTIYQHTSIVYDVLTQGEFYFYILQKTDVAGTFTDTLWIEPAGIDGVFPVYITGTVTDWSGGNVSWQSRNVTVTLRGDSLIFSGSGSTLDYSDYGSNIAPWREDISTHFSYDEQPKHVIVEPGVSRLGNYSLYGFEFQTIDFGQLDTLGSNLFTCCNHIDVLELPASLDFIDCDALSGVNPKKIINNLRPDVELCYNPFSGMQPRYVVANTTMLLEVYNPINTMVEPANDTIRDIYVSYGYAYEEPLIGYDLVVDQAMVLDEETIPAVQDPAVIIYSTMYDTVCGHLDVPVTTSLHMSKFVMRHYYGEESPFARFQQEVNWGTPYFSIGYDGVNTTLVTDGILTADTVMLRNKLFNNTWYFTGLPFNQKVSDILTGEHQYYCIRRFDAARQAAAEYDDVWVDVQPEDTLHAGEGFIIQTYTPTDDPQELTYTAMNDAAKQNIFTPSVQSLPLQHHPAEQVWDANWNFVVNPYPCFYDTRKIGGNGIITVYNNQMKYETYYESYSIRDDYYVLMPNEGFLYQAAAGENALRMPLEGRQHSARAAGISYQHPYVEWNNDSVWRTPERETRTILNFYLEQNSNKDRARVVLNEVASMDYEVGVDAAKLFAPGSTAAQLYAEQGGAKQSILERPTGNGIVYLGVKLMKAGDCTISIPETKGMDIMMLDTETNVMTNLSLTDYTFFGTPGENSGRFIIGLVGEATFLDYITGNSGKDVVKVIENGHVYILRGSDKYDVLGNKH